MSNAYDANGWEREPFGADGNIRNPEYEMDGPASWQKPVPAPTCSECRAGKGVVVPGPPHCAVHDRHCSAEECW